MSKKICISGYYGCGNFGDEIILDVLVENLKNIVLEPHITVFSLNPQNTNKQLGVKSVYSFDIKKVVGEIYKSDCLISGGGSLLQDITSVKSLLYYLFVIALAQILGKKTLIFAQGIGPINNNFLKKLTRLLLKRVDYITVRDDNSINLLKKYDINAQKCIDPAWNINIPAVQKSGKIGVQLRKFPLINEDFLDKLALSINKYYSYKEILILSLQDKLDLLVSEKLKAKLEKINPKIKAEVIKNSSNAEILERICSLNSLIAMRYHACLIGIKAGVKVLPINYDIKVSQLADNFSLRCINSVEDIEKEIQIFAYSEKIDKKADIDKFNFAEFFNFLIK